MFNMNRFLEKAETLDKTDPLKRFKDKFVANPSLIYLDGNSLGKLPVKTIETSANIVENQWGNRLIRSWNEHWIDLSKDIATKIAKIVGAQPDEIFVGDTTSLNLYKLLFASLAYQKDKSEIITDDLNLPFGSIRVKTKGSDGGHNGLKDIQEKLNTTKYNRYRFGISDTFSKGRQVDYVLGEWTTEELDQLKERLDKSIALIKSFGLAGINNTMNTFNAK